MPERVDFLPLLETILESDSGSLSFDSDLETAGWDSLADLAFIAEADTRWSVTVDPERLSESETPEDLWVLVSA